MSSSKVFVSPTEDVVFACDKVSKAPSEQVILTIPEGAHIGSSQVSLKLLARMLFKSNKLVVIVNEDDTTAAYATRAGLISVKKIADISPEMWDKADDLKRKHNKVREMTKENLMAERTEKTMEMQAREEIEAMRRSVEPEPEVLEKEEIDEEELESEEKVIPVIEPIITAQTPIEELELNAEMAQDLEPEKGNLTITKSEEIDEEKSLAVSEKHFRTVNELVADTKKESHDEEIKPLFVKMEPKITDLEEFSLLSGGDISESPIATDLKMKVLTQKKINSLKNKQQDKEDTLARNLQEESAENESKSKTRTALNLPKVNLPHPNYKEIASKTGAQAAVVFGGASVGVKALFAKIAILVANIKAKISNRQVASRSRTGHVRGRAEVNSTPARNFSRFDSNAIPRNQASRTARAGNRYSSASENEQEEQTYTRRDYNNEEPRGAGKILSALHLPTLIQNVQNNRIKIAAGLLVLLVVFSLLSIYVFAKTDVRITVAQTNVPINQAVTAGKDITATDLETLKIPLREISKSASRSDTIEATGKSATGTKAAGNLSVFNSGSTPVVIEAGTVVTSSSNSALAYTFNNKITVNTLQTVVGSVTAVDIGEQYNLTGTALKKFTLKDKTNSDITLGTTFEIKGGTKQDIKVVSQGDIDKLKTQLLDILKKSLKSDLGELISASEVKLLNDPAYGEPVTTSSKKAGEESDTVDVSITLEARMPVVSKTDLTLVAKDLISKSAENSGNFEILNLKEPALSAIAFKDGSATFTLATSGDIAPQIDKVKLKQQLAGTATTAVSDTVNDIPDVENVQVDYSPAYVPVFLRKMPSATEKINITVVKSTVAGTSTTTK